MAGAVAGVANATHLYRDDSLGDHREHQDSERPHTRSNTKLDD
jgi:hypothetical protein